MIFYFSGTGNSKWVAESLAGLLHEKTADISVLNFESAGNKEYKNYIEEIAQGIKNDEYTGFVFPVYAWGAPEIVTDFAKKLKKYSGNGKNLGNAADNPEGKTFTFALATCGEEAGYALKNFSKIIPLKSSYSLVMPNNYVVDSDLEDEGTVLSVLRNAKEEVKRMAEELIAKKEVCRVNEGSAAGLKSGLVNFGFNKFARSTKSFYTTDVCTGCGLCAKNCPARTITMENNRPVWGSQCYQCLKCINRCPAAAIQYGKATETRGRYTIEKYLGRI
ncbi:MAG: EFR1 family ferrodoxin [Candidatus Treponema excrementipullorum]|uniref:EFR1 family ferrodoxin n=1 Tax=Candidatus Treponema excrementipullorum TaxID=2838768 RepID=A0A9E2L267_9SPIR|nr:EFR1 family ferrodoxin [Candidatus Treponema excrementipullorum]